MDELNMVQVGRHMREARRARHITVNKLAGQADLSWNTLSAYERGLVCPGLRNLWALADVLGISLDEYVGRGKEPGA